MMQNSPLICNHYSKRAFPDVAIFTTREQSSLEITENTEMKKLSFSSVNSVCSSELCERVVNIFLLENLRDWE